ncbi:MAG: sodium:calcium antiporter, partial [Rickettsiales bacterium]
VLYTLFAAYDAKREEKDPELLEELQEETKQPPIALWLSLAMIAAGIGFLVLGADTLITGATTLAEHLGVSEAVIGATIVAVGGSAPELVTSLVAAWRKHADIGLANVVGSNIFNATAVVGVAGLASPMEVAPQFLAVDLRLMLGVTALFFIAMLARKEIGRIEGGLLLMAYAGYIAWQYTIAA